MGLSKAGSNSLHFKRRVEERLKVSINKDERRALIRRIRFGDTFFKRVTSSRSLHLLKFKGQAMLVLYDNTRSSIITVFPNREKLWINGRLLMNPAFLQNRPLVQGAVEPQNASKPTRIPTTTPPAIAT